MADRARQKTSKLIATERVQVLRDVEPRADGRYVLYWMQQSQRAEDNHALEHAVRWGNQLGLPVVVGFGLMKGYPDANVRHYRFMLEGLAETARALEQRGMRFVLRLGDPPDVALELASEAAVLICDRGYLRHQKQWREGVAAEARCRVEQVEADVVVPVELVSDKREYAARTIRPKIHRHLDRFLVELVPTPLERTVRTAGWARGGGAGGAKPGGDGATGAGGDDLGDPGGEDPTAIDALMERLDLDRSVPPVSVFHPGGTAEGKRRVRRFRDERLKRYTDHRNHPHTDDTTHLSPYLHFGQVSPLWALLEVTRSSEGRKEDRDAFLEELVVRRELAMNFVNFEPEYDAYAMLPGWAKETLDDHRDDEREHRYTRAELEHAETHDPYWNAAQREQRYTGYMHNYMRMYWGKQILAWSNTPEYAYRTVLYLNDKYFLDGRDPNSYMNVGWLFGLHDRAWTERDVFGKVRILTKGGLDRKTKPEAYVEKVDRLVERAKEAGVRFEGD